MTRPSKRKLEKELEELRAPGDGEFVRQAIAVINGERAQIDAEPPHTEFHELTAAVVKETRGSMFAAGEAVATADGVEPEPLADFTDIET